VAPVWRHILLTHPPHGNAAIGIKQAIAVLLFEISQAVYQGQKITNIVGALGKRPLVK
tara:strand:- start:12508 stop:12681 length:174 start_codon:yes stop_codon:yes gene_type:complete